MKFIEILAVSFCLILSSCSASQADKIVDFESCVAAGNKVMRSYPAKCAAPGVGIFVQDVSKASPASDAMPAPKVSEPLKYESACKDTCGDGECAEIVCMAVGCPCAETKDSCPQDCKE